MKKCKHGCGQRAKYKRKDGSGCCSKFSASCPALRKKNSDKIKKAHKDGRCSGWSQLENPNRGWSKGLTKKKDGRIRKRAEIRRKNIQSGKTKLPKRVTSKATREKLSKARTKYLEKTGGHTAWFNFNLCGKKVKLQGTWELEVAKVLVESYEKIDRTTLIFGHRRYTPDFFIEDLGVYLEVKGFYRDRDKKKYTEFFSFNPGVDVRMLHGKPTLDRFLAGEIGVLDLPKLIDTLDM